MRKSFMLMVVLVMLVGPSLFAQHIWFTGPTNTPLIPDGQSTTSVRISWDYTVFPGFSFLYCKIFVDGDLVYLGSGREKFVYLGYGGHAAHAEQWFWNWSGKVPYKLAEADNSFFVDYAPPPPPPYVTISGPTELQWKQQGTWTANPSGGTGSYSYQWRYRDYPNGTWSGVLSTASQYTRQMPNSDIELEVKVTSGGIDAYATHIVMLLID